jgi:hypothetical protein
MHGLANEPQCDRRYFRVSPLAVIGVFRMQQGCMQAPEDGLGMVEPTSLNLYRFLDGLSP